MIRAGPAWGPCRILRGGVGSAPGPRPSHPAIINAIVQNTLKVRYWPIGKAQVRVVADLVAFPKPGDPAGLWGVIHPGACGGKTPPRRVPLFKKVLSGPATIRGRVPAHAARGLAFAPSPSCRPPRQACETTEKGGMITEHTQACGRTEVRMPHRLLGPRPCRIYQNATSEAARQLPRPFQGCAGSSGGAAAPVCTTADPAEKPTRSHAIRPGQNVF